MTTITPRGRIYGVGEHDPLQPSRNTEMGNVETSEDVELIVDSTSVEDAVVHSESEEARGEFDDDTDSIDSDGSTSQSE